MNKNLSTAKKTRSRARLIVNALFTANTVKTAFIGSVVNATSLILISVIALFGSIIKVNVTGFVVGVFITTAFITTAKLVRTVAAEYRKRAHTTSVMESIIAKNSTTIGRVINR